MHGVDLVTASAMIWPSCCQAGLVTCQPNACSRASYSNPFKRNTGREGETRARAIEIERRKSDGLDFPYSFHFT